MINVLIVDDSLTVRMDLAEAFEAAGFRAVPCATASAARQALASQPIAVVILDVILPDGDGVDLLHELRTSPSEIKPVVLMLSSEAEVKDRIRALSHGADEYVGKPYNTDYVVARTRELLRMSRAGDVGERPRILVIDDSVTFREVLREALETAGYDVTIATTGEDGLRAAAALRPTAIVVDGLLPGINGPSVIRRIRLDAALRGITCMLLTGSDGEGAELRALDAGADTFVRKEEDMAVVLARLAAAVRAAEAAPAEQTASLLGPKKILAVDDSITYLQEIGEALRSDGYDVVLARSGEEALELLGVQRVDCILLDLMMPGLGGEQTCRRIKAAPIVRDTPLMILTAVEDREAMIASLGAGADDYISKAYDFEVVKARVRAQIRRKQFEDENRRIREELLHKELEATEERAAKERAESRAALVEELENKNRELEAFSYSVAHDLRAPLRTIDGFTAAIVEDLGDAIPPRARDDLRRVRKAAHRMGCLIDDLLQLARAGRGALERSDLDISAIAASVVEDLRAADQERTVEIAIAPALTAHADQRLVRVVLENLLGNAWKFTSRSETPTIAVTSIPAEDGAKAFEVRDNGAGFDMAYAAKLFHPFQRLHGDVDFPGTGIGLATIRRIVERHGGRVWARAKVGEGAVFSFTLPARAPRDERQ